MRKIALGLLCLCFAVGVVVAQEAKAPAKAAPKATASDSTKAEKKPSRELATETITAKYTGRIDEQRPRVAYDFDPYLDVGSVLGQDYVLDIRLMESIEKVSSKLLTMHSDYLRVPVTTPFVDLTTTLLQIPAPRFDSRPVSWELIISDSRGRVFRSIKGTGRPPQTIGWNGKGDSGELLTVGSIYSFELVATDDVGNRSRRIIEPIPLPGVIDRQDRGWIVSFDARDVFSGARPTEKGLTALTGITNLVKEKTARTVTVSAYSGDQAAAVADYIRQAVPYAQVEVRRLSERYVNVDVSFR